MRRTRLLVAAVLFAAGCSHVTPAQRQAALQKSLAAIDPNAEPAPPQNPPDDGVPQFNTEYYLGSADEELKSFHEFAEQINELQKQASRNRKEPVFRGFHAKSHGCLHGELHVRTDRNPRTRCGIFADDGKVWPVWVRFSNGVGWKQDDSTLDARGMAVKVMGVPGQKYLDDEKLTQDFLMTNSPTPVGADAAEFMEFAHANIKGRVAGIFFLLSHPRTAAPALLKTNAIDSVVTTQYWSGGAYHLGANQAVKFTAKPCDGTPARHPKRDSPDYLHDDLVAAAGEGNTCFTFYVQFQTDPVETPIENASKEWTEELSPLVPVADIILPKQTLAPAAFCDGLAFSPWHSIEQHKPMGNINRARRYVYAASQALRGHGPEPTPWTGDSANAPAPAPAPLPTSIEKPK